MEKASTVFNCLHDGLDSFTFAGLDRALRHTLCSHKINTSARQSSGTVHGRVYRCSSLQIDSRHYLARGANEARRISEMRETTQHAVDTRHLLVALHHPASCAFIRAPSAFP